jgi:carbonic anhydrase
MIEKFLEGNNRFIERDFQPNREYHQNLAQGQSPTVLWIGCSDSRVNPERITCSRLGEIFVHRNIGNVVPNNDWNFATVLEYAVNHLKVKDVVICAHSDCGAMKALDKETNDVYIPLWLNNARRAKQAVDSQMGKPVTAADAKERKRAIELENLRLQMEHLRNYPLVRKAEQDGRVTLHGLYYDLETGKLSKIL